MNHIIPLPAAVTSDAGAFALTAETVISVAPEHAELRPVGDFLAGLLRPATGYPLPVLASPPAPGHIHLTAAGADPALGDAGYLLESAPGLVTLRARRPEGVFHGVQTLRQMLPAAIERGTVQPGPWQIAAGKIRDTPRFPWRGMMLDVARHFFPVETVKHLIDLLALYKFNRLHLHLTDDQGWRIEIKAWPRLAEYGGRAQVGGGVGGYYTQADYAEIVCYAQDRYVTVVPEIDMPGHVQAALAAYPELSGPGIAPALYTGVEVGFSSLCITQENTYTFVEDVIREVAALTPGAYIHIGGDEALATPESDYVAFIERVQGIINRCGKQMVGWEEIASARLAPATIVQFWNTRGRGPELARAAAAQGARILCSPASRAYLDMKYDPTTVLGQDWAGCTELQAAYDWDPAALAAVPADIILGVESALWTETVSTLRDIEALTFPRLAGHAEIGWSPAEVRSWEAYRSRLAVHGARWQALGVNFYRSPQVNWATELLKD
jgi:hexosaminidase